jgi:hypothetical protein
MDESPDHEPTLIEWGMGVHLNHPITAKRGICNSRPARWELRKPHPPSRGETTRERTKQVEEIIPIASNGPRLGGSMHGYTSRGAPNADNAKYVHAAPPRPAKILPMPAETNTPHTGRTCEKTFQEHPRSCKTSRARPAGPLARPHGIAPATRGEESPINRRHHLRDPQGYTHRCSGATVGDNHKGPLNNQGKPDYIRKKTNANEPKSTREINPWAHNPSDSRPGISRAELRFARGAQRRTDKTPPRSRVSRPLG